VFENLIESSNKGSKSFGQSVLSLIIHGAVIFAAIEATKGAAEEIKQRVIDTTLVFLKPPEPTPPPPQDVVVSANPPPKGFQTVVPPDIIPKDIPPVDLSAKPFDPKDFSGKGVEGGISAGIEGGTGPVELGQVFLTSQLDDPAQRISGPPPRYPPVMQSAGIAGSVDLQFIVDTTGHVESNSLKVLAKTHDAFVEPAKEAVLKGVYKPARYKGEPVRQQVQQRISFQAQN